MIYLNTLLAEAKLKLNIPSDIKKLHKLFKKNGKQLYVVGGAVRDAILGKSPKDFDLTTDAKPDEVEKIVKQGGLKSIPVGKAFGVVNVLVGSNEYEIATFRKDIGKGRRPDAVDFTDIKGDVKRRDLTINALFYDIGKKQIVDLVGGIADLKKKKIRTVGKAEDRFDEDPLRKLRAVRFAGSVHGRMTKDTWNALKQNSDISGVSAERIRDEFIKGVTKAKKVPNYFKMLQSLGMFKQIFPGLNINTKFINTNDYIIQIANLLKNNHSSTVNMKLKKAKYTNQEVKDIRQLLVMSELSLETLGKNIYQIKGEQQNTNLKPQQVKQWASIVGKKVMKVWNFKLSVTAKDAIDKGLKGKDIGNYIKDKEKELFISS
jgi:tRNA nucleotidyltransferase/poly(A) polymerase